MMGKRLQYIVAEKDPLYLHALRNRFLRTPNVMVRKLDASVPEDFSELRESVETVLCINVLEFVEDPRTTLESVRQTLVKGGSLLVLVPQGRQLFGTVDRTLGHKRRFDEQDLRDMLQQCGFEIASIRQLNKVAVPAWWLSGKVLGRPSINKLTLKIFDKTVWLWKRLDWMLPGKGLSLVAVARRVE
jgi:hypothetical protein